MRTVFDKHKLAWKHFYPEGDGKAKAGYCLHHKDDTLRHENPDRYNEWRIEDLEMITESEHGRLHHTGVVYSVESRERMSKAQQERAKNMTNEERQHFSEMSKKLWQDEEYRKKCQVKKGNTPWNKGKHGCYSEEYIQHLREINTGRPSPLKGHKYTEEERRAKSERMKQWAAERKARLQAEKEQTLCG